MRVLNHAYEHPLKDEEKASMPLAGGIMQHGYQCGMVWGAAFAAGAHAYQLYGAGEKAQTMAVYAAQKTVESFRAQNQHVNCLEITEIDKSSTTMDMIMFFLVKGGTIGCFKMAARYAPLAFNEINKAFAEDRINVPKTPVSCAALLAEKIGATEMQTVMASGLAGGIGLCGGACGALGAAIWINAINKNKEGKSKVDFKDPKGLELVDKFLKHTNYEFECSAIVGRKFENIEDHAQFLKEGGCSKLIDVLSQI